MTAARETDALPLHLSQTEWMVLRELQHNVLLEGPSAVTKAVVSLLHPRIGKPIAWHHPPDRLGLPSADTGALILTDVAALSGDDQKRLLDWINDEGSQTRIVSMTERRLFALVESGVFNEALYYRLNLILLPFGSRDVLDLLRDDAQRGGCASCTPTPDDRRFVDDAG
jgi:hypothetical protein